jgi:hypothetical protein
MVTFLTVLPLTPQFSDKLEKLARDTLIRSYPLFRSIKDIRSCKLFSTITSIECSPIPLLINTTWRVLKQTFLIVILITLVNTFCFINVFYQV